jgi:hypothetical protein
MEEEFYLENISYIENDYLSRDFSLCSTDDYTILHRPMLYRMKWTEFKI